MKINEWPRHGIQALWAFITNSHVTGFVTGKIYTGKLKNACVPGLNCYSCPGAVGACPIGSLQAVIGSWNFKMAYYVVGFLIFIGAMVGRLICGFLCPFGLIQDLLNKIPFPKKIRTFKGDKLLRKLKYVIFASKFQKNAQKISSDSTQKIDQKVSEPAYCWFQSCSQNKKNQHIISQMLWSEMQKHTCEQTIIFSICNHRCVSCATLHHVHGILCASGKFHCKKYQNIYQDQKHGHGFFL